MAYPAFPLPKTLHIALLIVLASLTGLVSAAPQVGEQAPAFEATDTGGETWSLEALKGQPVILEWTNHDCPYVKKHYETGNMQALQRDAEAEGYVWLSVISSAPGKQGYVTAEEADALTESRDAAPSAVLLDPEGTIGRAYDARTTPHLYLIDEDGVLRYMGGIDDRATTDPADVEGATNYVRAAMAARAAGEAIDPSVTRPYGCSIKY